VGPLRRVSELRRVAGTTATVAVGPRSAPVRRASSFELWRSAGGAGWPGRHSQEESGLVRRVPVEMRTANGSFARERDGARPEAQHPGGQTLEAQQLRLARRAEERTPSALAEPAESSIAVIATKAIKVSRMSFRRRITRTPGPIPGNDCCLTSYAIRRVSATARRASAGRKSTAINT
jgi:hypothetical protein